jgi:hypothetical protein
MTLFPRFLVGVWRDTLDALRLFLVYGTICDHRGPPENLRRSIPFSLNVMQRRLSIAGLPLSPWLRPRGLDPTPLVARRVQVW